MSAGLHTASSPKARLPEASSQEHASLFLSRHHEFRRPQEGSFDLRIRKCADRLTRRFGVPSGLFGGIFEGPIAVQDVQDIGVRDAIEGAVAEDGFDLLALGGSAMF